MSEMIMTDEGKEPKCKMTIEKCLGCPMSETAGQTFNLPPRLMCILDDYAYIPITKCIKEA